MFHRWRTFAASAAIPLSLLLITTAAVAAAAPAPSSADARALLQFKLAVTSDLAGLLLLWSVTHHCSWPGVSCNSASRVTALNISAAGGGGGGGGCGIPVSRGCPNETRRLTGTLSPSLGELSELRILSLPFHRFYGEIPGEIWRLSSLEHLNLEGNSFSGSLPSLFPLSLLSLNLAGNSITGFIPSSLSSCSSLETLDLSRNNLNGTIATSLTSLPKLRKLFLSFNRLTGPVPGFTSGCRTLEQLDLAGNLLTGSIPRSLANCSELRVLDVSRNALSSTIPPELGQCKKLSVLVLTNLFDLMNIYSDEFNNFQGGLPESITALPKLRVLWAPRATVEGDIPSNWGSCESLEMVNLGQNLLTGKVPQVFTSCENLKFLNLSSNKLAGWLNEELRVPCMDVFDVSGNQLSGSIPKFVYKGCAPSSLPQADLEAGYYSFFAYKSRVGTSLPYFEHGGDYPIYHNFGRNMFTGNLPSLPIDASRFGKRTVYAFLADGNYLTGSLKEILFRKCKDLNGLIANVSNNMISGEIPVEIGAMCRSLLILDIAGNRITGSIPQSFGSVGSLVVLDLSWNRIDGHIPASLGELKDLKSLLLAGNNLSGQIPNVLVQIPALSVLDLSSNSLTGEIPGGLIDLANLTVLILSNNNLSGRIPTGLANLTSLSMFNVSFNNLSGPMPSSASVMSCASAIGNPLLLQSCHVYELSIPPSDLRDSQIYYNTAQTYYNTAPESLSAKSRSTEFSSIEIASIACAAAIVSVLLALVLLYVYTRKCAPRFSAAQSPGRREVTIFTDIGVPLTYESVARATGGFNTSNCIGSGGFGATYKAEVSPGVLLAIKRLSVGRFNGVQQFHAEIKTLGRLRHANLVTLIGYHLSEAEMFLVYNYLPGGNLDRFIQERAKRDADWRMLHKIALDVACALSYLHEQCAPRILHRDVKPSNILLDDEFNAYLSDFGLARLLGNSVTHATTGVAGTFGYVDPEYAMTCRVSNKTDVYSYGVVLMELISDKKVWDPSYSPYWSGFSIVNWATKLLDEGRAPEFFAEGLWDVAPHDDLLQTFRLAIKCTNGTVSDRPAMRQVVRRLKELQPPAL